MKIIHVLGLGLLMWCGTSCVFYTAPVKSTGQVNKNNALFYGHFYYGQHFAEELNPNWRTTGLWIKNVDAGRTLYLEFKPTNSVYAVQIQPGHYQIMGWVRSDNEHGVKNRMAFSATNTPGAVTTPFAARAGDQIYLGDYTCETKLDYPILHWRLKSIGNNFAITTAELRRSYPELPRTPEKSIFDRSLYAP